MRVLYHELTQRTGCALSSFFFGCANVSSGSGTGSANSQATTGTGTQIIADDTVVSQYDKIPQKYIDLLKCMWVNVPGESNSQAYRALTGNSVCMGTYLGATRGFAAKAFFTTGPVDAYTGVNARVRNVIGSRAGLIILTVGCRSSESSHALAVSIERDREKTLGFVTGRRKPG